MTSDGGRLTPNGTRVSVPKPVPHDVATSTLHSEGNPVPVSHTLHRHGRPQRRACGASVAQDYGAEVISLDAIGTRQCAIDPLLRTRHSQATHLVFVSDAGPCGSWLYRDLRTKASDCWGVAPSLMPKKAGDRVKTDRRHHPCPKGAGRRGLGVPLSREGQPTSATATGKTTANPPGQQLEGTSQAV